MGITCEIVRELQPSPKVAHNSPRSVFNTVHKGCNFNEPICMFERFTWNYVRPCWGTMLAMPLMPGLSTSARQLAAPHSTPERSPPHTAPPNTAHPTQHPAHAARPTHKGPRPRPTGIGDEAGAGSVRQRRRAHSLTAPAVRPDTMYFCRYWNNRITGTAAITEPAAKMPHGAVRESAAHMYMPTASVN